MSASTPEHVSSGLVVPASHPMLAGHFPGRPIVPGAWLLATIMQLADRWLEPDGVQAAAPAGGRGEHSTAPRLRVAGVRVVKFMRPVLPEQPCRVVFSHAAGGVRFVLKHDEDTYATGTLLTSEAPDAAVGAGPPA